MGTLLIPDQIVTRTGLQTGQALLIESGMIARLGPVADLQGPGNEEVQLPDQTLAPGLVDLQVNGGGGCLLNDEPTLEGIRTLVCAHQQSGSTTILPTLISCDLPTMVQAREAVEAGLEQNLPGLAGLHFEGPFLDQSAALTRPSLCARPPRRTWNSWSRRAKELYS